MKHTITVLLLLSAQFVNAQGNSRQLEIAGVYGKASGPQAFYSGHSHNTHIIIENPSGTVFFNCNYFLTPRFSIGLAFGSEQFFTALHEYDKIYRKSNYTYTTAAFELKYIYYNQRWLRFYARAGVGYFWATEKSWYYNWGIAPRESNTSFDKKTAQVTPIALSVGGRLSGFAEFGYGYNGVLVSGLCYRVGEAKPTKQP